jgi:hypothetical protein
LPRYIDPWEIVKEMGSKENEKEKMGNKSVK